MNIGVKKALIGMMAVIFVIVYFIGISYSNGVNTENKNMIQELTQETVETRKEITTMSTKVTELQNQLDTATSELKKLQDAFKELGVDF